MNSSSKQSIFSNPFFHPLVLLVVAGLISGVIFWAIGMDTALAVTAYVVIGIVIIVTAIGMVKELLAGHWGLDILAVVAMIATLAVEEYIAGMIIALMLTGGEALEILAEGRATRELDSLINRRPSFAQRVDEAGNVVQIAVDEVAVGDILVVRPSDVIPVDGELISEDAYIDESSVTGEPLPVHHRAGDEITSGTVNSTEAFRMRATTTAADSHYASIIKLVQEAVDSQAPMVRLADRYAVPFTVISLIIAGVAWYVSGNPTRFAEVLVVATPCPLLIGAPVAFMGGMSSAAKANVIVKDGGALERMARLKSVAFDKTGTLTQGRPTVARIHTFNAEEDEVLGLAAAAEQYSVHVFAAQIVQEATDRKLPLAKVSTAEEIATNGVRAVLEDGSQVRVGKSSFIAEVVAEMIYEDLQAGETAVYVAKNDSLWGIIVLSDPLRETSAATIKHLHTQGVDHMVMVTGDTESTARSIADVVGLEEVHAGVTPQDKVNIVTKTLEGPTAMLGDGINDAPVLAAADVGIAMGARGATAASESADAVITSENIGRLADLVEISKRTVRIALQSIWFGMAVSVGLMTIAALGYLPAVFGALLQEVVDLVAIGVALRALAAYKNLPSASMRDNAAVHEAVSTH